MKKNPTNRASDDTYLKLVYFFIIENAIIILITDLKAHILKCLNLMSNQSSAQLDAISDLHKCIR